MSCAGFRFGQDIQETKSTVKLLWHTIETGSWLGIRQG